ncbi:uncharacterized protein K441DRAFT_225282 [Cenococcum geophilum 1.58]|uniref:uncharacterized protein n=1 Tax=Cenococcum geophilum 1.58 TaxID=794803 RepID=UPI00358ECF87|nr:hypothetical protein K441DRAFT_225282 [Cenococcum geophilum 1.58]
MVQHVDPVLASQDSMRILKTPNLFSLCLSLSLPFSFSKPPIPNPSSKFPNGDHLVAIARPRGPHPHGLPRHLPNNRMQHLPRLHAWRVRALESHDTVLGRRVPELEPGRVRGVRDGAGCGGGVRARVGARARRRRVHPARAQLRRPVRLSAAQGCG